MAIDASIYGQIQQPKPVNLLAQYAQAMELQNMQERMGSEREVNQLRRMQLEQATEERRAKQNWLNSTSPETLGVDGGNNALARLLWEGARAGAVPVSDYFTAIKPKDPKYQTVGGALVRVDTPEPKEVYRAPDKPEPTPGAIREYQFAQGQGYKGTFEQWTTAQKRAGASTTSVTLGSPVPVELPGGGIGYVQPANRPGAAPQVMILDGKPLTKPVPMSEATQKELTSINQQRAIIRGAIDEVKKTPDAFSFQRGLATMAGPVAESIAGRVDNDAQRQARSYLFNNVSKVINERAGAAQSAQELSRLRSFLPAETDNAEQIVSKMEAFDKYLSDMEAGTRMPKTGAPAPSATPKPGGAARPDLSQFKVLGVEK